MTPIEVSSVALPAASREQLVHLLAEAAELEHNLLCCYLYAAFSLKLGDGESSDPDHAAVKRWYKEIMRVAMEEMTHLALIANLTVAIGARPHFNRPNLPPGPLYHPGGIVAELARFDRDTLDHFIYLERPDGAELADGASFAATAQPYTRGERPGASLLPAATDYATIGEFYLRLRELLCALAAHLGEKVLFCGDASLQITERDVDLHGLCAVNDLTTALSVLDLIVLQGEGGGGQDDSHFNRFVAIRAELDDIVSRRPDFEPAWPAARNPVMRHAVTADRVHIDNAAAAPVLDMANAVYALVLRLLTQAWGRPSRSDVPVLLQSAVRLMAIMGQLGRYLCSLPASSTDAIPHAGITFTMLRATEPLVSPEAERIWMHERIGELVLGARVLAGTLPKAANWIGQLEEVQRAFNSTRQIIQNVAA
jgi:hypothetical protein